MILVVDDDKELTQLVRELLEAEGYEVRTVNNGAEAYLALRDPKCKGILLDFHMPGINGAELLLLMASEGIATPVIVMTGDPGFDEAEMKQFANVRKLLRKPFYPEDLIFAVRALFEQPSSARG